MYVYMCVYVSVYMYRTNCILISDMLGAGLGGVLELARCNHNT